MGNNRQKIYKVCITNAERLLILRNINKDVRRAEDKGATLAKYKQLYRLQSVFSKGEVWLDE